MIKENVRKLTKLTPFDSMKLGLKQLLNKIFFFGFKFSCPICGSRLRALKPFGVNSPAFLKQNIVGGGLRKDALCPVCRSTDRERLLYLFLLNKTNFFTEKIKVLHVAPEPSLNRVVRKYPNVEYLTADISGVNVMVQMDVTEIQYSSETFDVIICNHVLEHIPDDKKAMSELYRVLKKGGWGILQVPISLSLTETYEDSTVTDPSKREAIFGQSDHVRIYAMDYLDKLEKSGFEVKTFDWQDDLELRSTKNKFGLLKSEKIFVVYKH